MENILKDTITIILGGGKGTRLMPLTEVRSKPAVPFGGKYRIVDIPISNSINNGLSKIFILTQFNSFSLNRHIFRTYKFDSFSKGFIELIAAEQTNENMGWFQGTADAVRQVLPHLEYYKPKYVLILSGDQLYKMNIREMIYKHHEDRKRDVTISCIPVAREFAPSFGLMKIGSSEKIVDFTEKPQEEKVLDEFSLPDGTKRCMASMGIYLFDYEVLCDILTKNTDKTDFGKHIIPEAIHTHVVKSYNYSGYWEDIGTIRAFFEANLKMAGLHPPFDLYVEKNPLYTRPRYLPPAKILDSRITSSLIGEGSIIMADEIKNCVIGIRSIVRSKAVLENVVMMGSDHFTDYDAAPGEIEIQGIGHNCLIKNAILDKQCYIGNNVELINKENHVDYKDEYISIHDGIIVVSKGTRIPDGYKI
jgi:glucose-1-phosphate adenylyltransferase